MLGERMDWNALSDRALWTIARIVHPISQGFSRSEVAASLGKTEQFVKVRLREMRDEIIEIMKDEEAA